MKTREPERQAVARCRDAWVHWRAERRACIARGQAEEAAIAEALEVQAKVKLVFFGFLVGGTQSKGFIFCAIQDALCSLFYRSSLFFALKIG